MKARVLFLSAALAAASLPAAAQSLRAYAGSVAGQARPVGGANCGTYAPSIFEWGAGLSLPLGGIAGCSLAGGEDNQVATRGTVTASQSAFGNVPDGTYTGSAQARASYGSLGVASSGVMTGGRNGAGTAAQSAAFASFSDVLTLTSPSAAPGQTLLIDFGWTVEGSLNGQSVQPFGLYGGMSLGTKVNGRQLVDAFAVILNARSVPFFSGTNFVENNFVLATESVSGSGRVQPNFFYLVQAGTPFTLEAAMRDLVLPCCYGASVTSSFLQTAQLSSIRVLAGVGREITDFSISSASGTLYTRDGVAPVPEPGTAALALAGLALLFSVARGRTANRSTP